MSCCLHSSVGILQQRQLHSSRSPAAACHISSRSSLRRLHPGAEKSRGVDRRALSITACAAAQPPKTPKGVTQPPTEPRVPPGRFGFVDFAERINSRAAMIGFFALLIVEGIFGKGILETFGIGIGGGLGIEL